MTQTSPKKWLKKSALKLGAVANEMGMSEASLRYYLNQAPMNEEVLGKLRITVRKITEKLCTELEWLQP